MKDTLYSVYKISLWIDDNVSNEEFAKLQPQIVRLDHEIKQKIKELYDKLLFTPEYTIFDIHLTEDD